MFCRLAIARFQTEISTAFGVLASRASTSLVYHLFFQRSDEMSRHRLVEWFQCLALPDPSAFQRHRSRDTRKVERPVPSRRNLYLPVGNRISIFYLAEEHEKVLVDWHLRNALRNWPQHGDASLRLHHDRSECSSVRCCTYSLGAPQDQLSAPGSCLVKLLDPAGMRTDRSLKTAFVADHACLPSPRPPVLFSTR